jgi:predicted MPP superfamily phosphohydrolase
MLWAICSTGAVIVYPFWKGVERFNPQRRRALIVLRNALAVAPVAAAGYGTFIERNWFRITEVRVAIPGLPKDLDGLRMVQLTDIHLSAFLSLKELARVVDMANETRPHIALVTGDIITGTGDPLEAGIGQLARLRGEAGTLGCMGNHEIYAHVMDLTENLGARQGILFLRSSARLVKFGTASLNVAGVDYQRMGEPYLRGAGTMLVPGATNILLSHNPDVFPVAARQGWDLTIAGHMHGGQISVEILGENLSVARLYTPYVHGLYRGDASAIYVSRGVGTVGIPTRIGAPPEVSLIRLCAI